MSTRARIVINAACAENLIEEGCYISEWWNSPDDPAASVARARVPPGVRTRWHCLRETVERYVILAGQGIAEVGRFPPMPVSPGDVVVIPAGERQRIRNAGAEDLVFLAICTPRFTPEAYEDLGDEP